MCLSLATGAVVAACRATGPGRGCAHDGARAGAASGHQGPVRPLIVDGRKFGCRKFELEFVHIGSLNYRMQLRCCKPSQRKFQLPYATNAQQTVV